MTRILDYNGNDADRTTTVQDIRALKGSPNRFAQVTAATPEEAAAAESAGMEMAVCLAQSVVDVRKGSQRLFVTAAIDFTGAVSKDELLGVAFDALSNGADAVISARSFACVEHIASEDIPVMGHLGFVPKKSTLYGGVRGVGKTSEEALALWNDFRRLEDAGAFGVECELIPAAVMSEINPRTSLATISLGSGPDADVVFLFANDICGEQERVPRHARRYGNLASLYAEVEQQRVAALTAFRADVASRSYPNSGEVVHIDESELDSFVAAMQP